MEALEIIAVTTTPAIGITTKSGKAITQSTAERLDYVHDYAQMESVGRRVWTELLTQDEQAILGGDFAAAFRDGGTAGMYHRLYPGLSYERAMLELLRELGAIQLGPYRRLLTALEENEYLPAGRGAQPVWDGRNLFFNGEIIRTLARPGKATRLKRILDAFERHGWPHHLSSDKLGNPSAKWMSDSLDELRKGLIRITFEMDGSGTGINWRPV